MSPKKNENDFKKFYNLIRSKQYTTAILQEFLFFNRKCDDIFEKMDDFNAIIEKNNPTNFEKKTDNFYL